MWQTEALSTVPHFYRILSVGDVPIITRTKKLLLWKKEENMEEGKMRKIEAQLRQLIALDDKAREEEQTVKKYTPPGTRVIRRRKDTPDKHIM